jgi:hypothetical protein
MKKKSILSKSICSTIILIIAISATSNLTIVKAASPWDEVWATLQEILDRLSLLEAQADSLQTQINEIQLTPGPPGLSCWDLDGDGNCSSLEDVNQDGECNATDCRGPPGTCECEVTIEEFEALQQNYQDLLARVIALEGGCLPNCTGKECGDDGCGGSCGDCPEGYYCDNGVCVEGIPPNCTEQEIIDFEECLGYHDPLYCLGEVSENCSESILDLFLCAMANCSIDFTSTWQEIEAELPCIYANCTSQYEAVFGLPQDNDGDEYNEIMDCNDTNPEINPGAAENCTDLKDNDCDEKIDCSDISDCASDPNCMICEDLDGDDYYAQSDHCSIGTDCNDQDNNTYPGALELCDGEDNDCDNEIDEDSAIFCNDSIACTIDVCDGGTCANVPDNSLCEDNNECTNNICDSDLGCIYDPVQNGTPCDDGDPTTIDDSCQSGVCVGIQLEPGDICADPQNITGEGVYLGNTTSMTNNYENPWLNTTGPEVVYRFVVPQSGLWHFLLEPDYDSVLWFSWECGDYTTISGWVDEPGVAPEAAWGPLNGSDTVFIYVDGWAGDSGNYSLTITFLICEDLDGDGYYAENVNCSIGTDCDDLDNNTYPGALELCDGKDNDCDDVIDEGYCDDNNECTVDICDSNSTCINEPVPDGTICDDGIPTTFDDTCQSGVCVGIQVPGDACADPFEITGEGVYLGNTTSMTNDYEISNCSTSGPEVVYRFDVLETGQWNFTLVGDYDSVLWISTECGDNETNVLHCIDEVGIVSEELIIQIESGQTVFVFVDGWTSSAEGTYSLYVTLDTSIT